MFFVNDSSNLVNELSYMLSEKIEVKHFVHNHNNGGYIYLLALSEVILVSLGFLCLLLNLIYSYIYQANTNLGKSSK